MTGDLIDIQSLAGRDAGPDPQSLASFASPRSSGSYCIFDFFSLLISYFHVHFSQLLSVVSEFFRLVDDGEALDPRNLRGGLLFFGFGALDFDIWLLVLPEV